MFWLWTWWVLLSRHSSTKLWESSHSKQSLSWSIRWFRELSTFTTVTSSTETLSQIISVSDWTKPATRFSFSISDWPKDTSKEMENIFLTERGKTSQALPGMLPSTPIWVLSKHAEMIWKALGMFACTFWEECCHGKGWKLTTSETSTKGSKKRSWQLQLKYCARVTQLSSQSTWALAETCDSTSDRCIHRWERCSRSCLTRADTLSTTNTIG